MKKNRMMRLASILLVCVLLSTSVISGTFAKYVTKVEGEDSARVARWGFTGKNEDITITDLFKTTYDNENVQGQKDVIAPGTANQATIQFKYFAGDTDKVAAPEVAYTFEISTEGSSCADAIKNNENIKWIVYKSSQLPADANWGSWDNMIMNIKALAGTDGNVANDGKANYAPGKLPDITEQYTIAWKWDFETSEDANVEDTTMGNASDLADVVIKIKVTATQIN